MNVIRPFKNILPLKHEELNKSYASHVIFPNLFNDSEIELIKALWNEEEVIDAKVKRGDEEVYNYETRKSNIMYLQEGGNEWIYDKISMACILTNTTKYKFDILGFQSLLKIASYEKGQFFNLHNDYGTGSTNRKISFSILLSNPEEYDGGDLQIVTNKDGVTVPRQKGACVFFPSFIAHRVLEVTSGCRKSLVGHIAGPPFR